MRVRLKMEGIDAELRIIYKTLNITIETFWYTKAIGMKQASCSRLKLLSFMLDTCGWSKSFGC